MANYEVEPWPGYAKQDDDARVVTLEHKLGEALRRGDLLYGIAVCAAVAACEKLERADGAAESGAGRLAKSRGNEIHDYGKQHVGDDAGGWTPK
jgi:hypothetical protein